VAIFDNIESNPGNLPEAGREVWSPKPRWV